MSNPYAPPGENAYDLWVERSNLNGVLLSAVGYGILFTITLQTLLLFFQAPLTKVSWRLVSYVVVLFCLASIGFGGNAKFNQQTFIDDRNFPGGPNAFTIQFYGEDINFTALVSFVVMSWMADGLVLWRFTVIFGNNYWLSLFPALMFAGSIASSLGLMISVANSSTTFWASKTIQFGIAYWSLSISVNVILAFCIAGRIWYVRHRTKALRLHPGGQYISITAMIIESAALYATWGLVFLICYARNTPFQNILLPPLGQVQGIAPLLILFRVAKGRAWSQSTVAATTTLGAPPPNTIPLSNMSMHGSSARTREQGVKVDITVSTDWDNTNTKTEEV
ncbi:hypothetical protein K438DRAFT_1974881 [Mycena galopus ATCC 62051]|nr:hypothetical protein K438DRAFT_1974881 [Mycena galopus ATCC 62051]